MQEHGGSTQNYETKENNDEHYQNIVWISVIFVRIVGGRPVQQTCKAPPCLDERGTENVQETPKEWIGEALEIFLSLQKLDGRLRFNQTKAEPFYCQL